ncbi:uncharacterized protein BDZ99DRAFT_386542, partial [Mytilinidion resinicola]
MYDNATRAQALTLKAMNVPSDQITAITGMSERTIRDVWKRAIDRGWNPQQSLKVLDIYVQDAPRSGRPTVQTPRKIAKMEKLITKSRAGRELNTYQLAEEVGISATTAWRILRRHLNMRKTKPTRKPGLQKWMKQERLQWCLDYQHWTLKD